MITRTLPAWHTTPWQKLLAEAIRDPAELLARLELPQQLLPAAQQASGAFPLLVPQGYLARMEKGNPADPLLRQVLPLAEENARAVGYDTDPVGDLAALTRPGLLHKYRGRVLLVTTAACGIHCRYCFRRHFPYQDATPRQSEWQQALAYIAADPSIEEVILSGGDPLSLADQRLHSLLKQLHAIPHLRRLRVHSRYPVILPERVTERLCSLLQNSPLQTVMVIHANHANEIDTTVAAALQRLQQAGITLLNQSVLLRGVNDDLDTLVSLSQRLFETGVLPYYLHMLDRVQGAAHFEVAEPSARQLYADLQACLPGYLVPRLVREQAGAPAKTPVR